jgi:hypothetical protein
VDKALLGMIDISLLQAAKWVQRTSIQWDVVPVVIGGRTAPVWNLVVCMLHVI